MHANKTFTKKSAWVLGGELGSRKGLPETCVLAIELSVSSSGVAAGTVHHWGMWAMYDWGASTWSRNFPFFRTLKEWDWLERWVTITFLEGIPQPSDLFPVRERIWYMLRQANSHFTAPPLLQKHCYGYLVMTTLRSCLCFRRLLRLTCCAYVLLL